MKVSLPIISNEEIMSIDKNWQQIVDEVINTAIKEKDQLEWQLLIKKQKQEIERLNNIINEIEKDIKSLYTYGIKNNREQKEYLLNRLEGLKALKGDDK